MFVKENPDRKKKKKKKNRKYSTEWVRNPVIIRTKNLEYDPRGNEIQSSLSALKSEIKQWVPENGSCRICKKYLHNIRFYLMRLVNVFFLLFFLFDTL